jgi:hypothetical protein
MNVRANLNIYPSKFALSRISHSPYLRSRELFGQPAQPTKVRTAFYRLTAPVHR